MSGLFLPVEFGLYVHWYRSDVYFGKTADWMPFVMLSRVVTRNDVIYGSLQNSRSPTVMGILGEMGRQPLRSITNMENVA